jgi:nucleotide-binding universal stress UspA family protein
VRINGTVLFVSDLSVKSDHALREAAALAAGAPASLVVCHVLPEVVGIRPLFPQLRVFDREEARQLREWATRALEAQLERTLASTRPRPTLRIESGSTHAAALDLADELGAGLIVVGGEFGTRDVASAAALVERIARHAPCPVLLSLPVEGKAVLAATDFSDPALPAVHAAQAQAGRLSLPLYVLHSVDLDVSVIAAPEMGFIASPGTLLSSYAPTVLEARRTEARGLLEELSQRLGQGLVLLREGPAVEAIRDAADSVDAALVVVGTHGRTGLSRLALGSVAEGVLRSARRSTLVVPLNTRTPPATHPSS